MPSLATSDQLHLHPVLTTAVAHNANSPLQALLGLVQVQWPPGTEEKADRLFNQLYECVPLLFTSSRAEHPWCHYSTPAQPEPHSSA